MRLTSRVHGMLDVVIALVLLGAAFTIAGGPATPGGMTAIVVAALLLANMALTDFEFGLMKAIQIPIHLWLDGILGLFLAISPWLVGFDQDVWLPHLVAGILIILVAFLTDTVPGYDRRSDARAVG